MASVYLTLDSKIQFVLEDALDKAMKDTKAASAAVILMDPNTGAILGMANRPSFDPNTFYKYPAFQADCGRDGTDGKNYYADHDDQ